LTYRSKIIKIS